MRLLDQACAAGSDARAVKQARNSFGSTMFRLMKAFRMLEPIEAKWKTICPSMHPSIKLHIQKAGRERKRERDREKAREGVRSSGEVDS